MADNSLVLRCSVRKQGMSCRDQYRRAIGCNLRAADHIDINVRILYSGAKAQEKKASRNRCVYEPSNTPRLSTNMQRCLWHPEGAEPNSEFSNFNRTPKRANLEAIPIGKSEQY